MDHFIDIQIDKWCESAYKARNIIIENKDYVVAKNKVDKTTKKILRKEGFFKKVEYQISPVDFENTGVVNLNMNWSDGFINFFKLNMV